MAAVCLAAGCRNQRTIETIEGKVLDATMNNIMILTDAGDTVNVSKMDANPEQVPGVMIDDRVSVECVRKLVGDVEIISAVKLVVTAHSPYYYIAGTWVEPNPIEEGQFQGMKLEPDGSASSVNMFTLVYRYWVLEGDKLILSGQSIGNKQTIDFTDTLKVLKLDDESLVLANGNNEVKGYVRQK